MVKKYFRVLLDEDTHTLLKKKAAEHKRPMQNIVEELVVEFTQH